jgi:2-iminobutanoate/2-iminopropanoate deaminase
MSDTPGGAPRPVGPYTPAIRAGDWLICSGQIGLKDGAIVDGGVDAQLTQCIANLAALLESHGSGLDQVVKTTVFMVDIADYDAINAAYMAAFANQRPARSAVAVAGLPRGALVEVEAWAYTGTR